MNQLALLTLNYPVDTPGLTLTTEHFVNAAIWAGGVGAIAKYGFDKNFWAAAGIALAAIYVNYLTANQSANSAAGGGTTVNNSLSLNQTVSSLG